MNEKELWKKCTTCKSPINYSGTYFTCSVSTCNTKRAAMYFCSIRCYDSHIPVMRHKESFYQESKAPKNLDEAMRLENPPKKRDTSPEEKKQVPIESSRKIIVRKKQP